MRAFACPVCDSFIAFEADTCGTCQTPLGLHLPSKSMVAIADGAATVDGAAWLRCTQYKTLGCNWLAFDLLSSYSTGERVTIGHANGVITIDLVESLDAYRESLRVRLGEPYRTMLGHFRHEVGHYYQWVLVETSTGATTYLDECRRLFGDERVSYADAIARHYTFGAPQGWETSFISEYATMHPWEDFAECFAHYLHIADTMDTAREAGMVLYADRVRFNAPRDIAALESYDDAPIERMLFDWQWMSLFFNRVNTAMGKNPLYPFEIPSAVTAKLGFVHRVIRDTVRS